MRRLIPALAVALGCEGPTLAECIDRVDPDLRERDLIPEDPTSLELSVDPNVRIVTINVGNDGRDERYALRLSYQAYEDFVAGLRGRRLAA